MIIDPIIEMIAMSFSYCYTQPRTWNRTMVAGMGAVMKGLRLSELQDLDTSVIDVAMETMAKDDTVPASKKRVILKRVSDVNSKAISM